MWQQEGGSVWFCACPVLGVLGTVASPAWSPGRKRDLSVLFAHHTHLQSLLAHVRVIAAQLGNEDVLILYFLHTLPLPTEIGSDAFQKFLNLLGDKITLKGWTGYRGGLDTKSKLASRSLLLSFV